MDAAVVTIDICYIWILSFFLLQPRANSDCADDKQWVTKRVRPEFLL